MNTPCWGDGTWRDGCDAEIGHTVFCQTREVKIYVSQCDMCRVNGGHVEDCPLRDNRITVLVQPSIDPWPPAEWEY